MKRPLDPRHHGLREPFKVIELSNKLFIADLDRNNKVSLSTLINAWNKTVKDLESQGYRITEEPVFESGIYYSHSLSLTYTYEWDNVNYEAEKQAYDKTITDYLTSLALWKAHEAATKIKAQTGDLDYQIERAEHRLANLLARKNNQPIPYPES